MASPSQPTSQKKRILSGVKPTGKAHIGNYLGAMRNHVNMQDDCENYIFIADLHSLTTVKNKAELHSLILDLALDYLALGLNPDKAVFFRQSDVPEHAELTWILNCLTPMPMLELAHAYKDAVAKGIKEINAGLFTYPVLMAVDILIYKPDIVPVGKDQKQHVEIARDLAGKFNRIYGDVFKLPEPYIPEEVAVVIGTDGQKMSKSYGNTIEIFASDKDLKKQVMGIKTDSTPVEAPKEPDTIYKLYSYFASEDEKAALLERYRAGGLGYGEAKKLLLEKVTETFKPFREERERLKNDLSYVKDILKRGAEQARVIASRTKAEVWDKTGLSI
ncbi:MAG TPA: tryptophan--tRNA ligase [Ignavibacteria bacterium]|nr:tryptophan--tRNA ligase [Ignavibacteria bacterium]HAX47346.1 tryptophan--tRNA ligase [Bacteroidota bacterium]HRE12253.1 tryptophan--tRNA ligase [Ignavibacteria bacterium]HRF67572.1 tryptophan--tRNA ligase [Ignavibacteria bacterium]HRJ05376.1 tryptophan--tRNA ligase [Ignavibacteria bacterium]